MGSRIPSSITLSRRKGRQTRPEVRLDSMTPTRTKPGSFYAVCAVALFNFAEPHGKNNTKLLF